LLAEKKQIKGNEIILLVCVCVCAFTLDKFLGLIGGGAAVERKNALNRKPLGDFLNFHPAEMQPFHTLRARN